MFESFFRTIVFSSGQFWLTRITWQCWETSLIIKTEGDGCHGHLVDRDKPRDAIKHPVVQEQTPTPPQSVIWSVRFANSAKAEEPLGHHAVSSGIHKLKVWAGFLFWGLVCFGFFFGFVWNGFSVKHENIISNTSKGLDYLELKFLWWCWQF